MNDWAARRKSIYLGGVAFVLTAIALSIFWKFWYQAPTCFDKTKNGDEAGVDCGGSCTLVCSDSIAKPIIRWDPRLLEVLPGTWSVVVYVENPNTGAEATYAPYKFSIYDEKNNLIGERSGATILPKNKTVGIFEGNLTFEKGVRPRRAIFELGNDVVWEKNSAAEPDLAVTHSPLLRLESTPRVEANVKNESLQEVKNIELVAAIFDGSDNVIAASKTFVDSLKADQSSDVFFTWPKPFELGSKVCEKSSNIMLLLDRSGSMSSVSQNPVQPLTDAKEAAASFIERLGGNNRVGVVSFATTAKNPIDNDLTKDFELAKKSVANIQIEKGSTQYTNIYDALHAAWGELVSGRTLEGANKIIILLTDGVATAPRDPAGAKTEAADVQYAENLALKESAAAKGDGVSIYTIGLGKEINEAFLKQVASSPDNYLFAPTSDNLENIYNQISSDICKEMPARIEITYKILETSN